MEKRTKELILMKAKGDNSGNRTGEGLVDFLARFTASDQFAGIFKEGMGLVEETANYLDGPERRDPAIGQLAGALEFTASLGVGKLDAQAIELRLQLLGVGELVLLRAPACGERRRNLVSGRLKGKASHKSVRNRSRPYADRL